MRNKIFLLSLFFATFLNLYSMKLAPNIIVECKDCGAEKELISIVSGNSFGAILWSDGFQYAPMLPVLSPVQKCMKCNSYFMLDFSNIKYSEDTSQYSQDTGQLSYKEMREALIQLLKTNLSKEDEIKLRIEFLHRYNDAFRDSENINLPVEMTLDKNRDDVDESLHKINLKKLIGLIEDDPYFTLLAAELYRELGNYGKSVEILKGFEPTGNTESVMKSLILFNAENANSNLILIDTAS